MIFLVESIRYILLLVLLFSGISKFIPDPRIIQVHFPLLPSAFWPMAGAWELGIAILLWLQNDFIATVMCYVFLGGVLGSTLLLKGSDGLTMAGKSYGVALVPVGATPFSQCSSSSYLFNC